MKEIKNVKNFSNAIEYGYFMKRNCERCIRYVWYEDATPVNPPCSIEERISKAMLDESEFPSEFIKQEWVDGKPCVPFCTEKNKPVVGKQLSLLEDCEIWQK